MSSTTNHLKQRAIVTSTSIVIAGTILSNILAIFRELIIAKYFGATYITDAYVIAFTIVSIFSLLFISGAIQGAFIPVFAQSISQNEDESWKLASSFLNIVLMFFMVLYIIISIFAPLFTSSLAPGFTFKAKELTTILIRAIFPMVIFTATAYVITSILQTYKHFTLPAFAPAISNLIVIFSMIILFNKFGIFSLVYGLILGSLGQIFFQIPGIYKNWIIYSPFIFYHPLLKKTGRLMLPIVIYIALGLFGELFQKFLASRLSEGSIAALNFALKIVSIPTGLFGMGLVTVIFPIMASYSANGDIEKVKEHLLFGLKSLCVVLLPISFAILALSLPIVRILFERGAFTYQSSIMTSRVLIGYSIGLFAQGALLLLIRSYYALSNTTIPLKIGILAMFLQILFSLILIRYLGIFGLSLATSLYTICYTTFLFISFRRHFGFSTEPFTSFFLKIFFSSALFGLVSFLSLQFFKKFFFATNKIIYQILQLIFPVSLGLIIYIIMIFILSKNEIILLWQTLRRR